MAVVWGVSTHPLNRRLRRRCWLRERRRRRMRRRRSHPGITWCVGPRVALVINMQNVLEVGLHCILYTDLYPTVNPPNHQNPFDQLALVFLFVHGPLPLYSADLRNPYENGLVHFGFS